MRKVSLLALALALLTLPLCLSAAVEPSIKIPPGDGGGTGGGCVTSCAVECSDGSWSSIGCLSDECAKCTCSGSPVLANPRCD
jgi:hypothetical protein